MTEFKLKRTTNFLQKGISLLSPNRHRSSNFLQNRHYPTNFLQLSLQMTLFPIRDFHSFYSLDLNFVNTTNLSLAVLTKFKFIFKYDDVTSSRTDFRKKRKRMCTADFELKTRSFSDLRLTLKFRTLAPVYQQTSQFFIKSS